MTSIDGMPDSLVSALNRQFATQVTGRTFVSGGDISHAAKVDLADGHRLFVKWRFDRTQIFAAEARGLELLRSAHGLKIPDLFAHQAGQGDQPGFIVMEWLGRGQSSAAMGEALGRGLVALHRTTGSAYGLDHDNFIGANPQANRLADDWVSFFRAHRLQTQMVLAERNGYLNARRARLLDKLLDRLDDWLPADPPASLLHGDLWSGNWLVTAAGEPALIDPAVYYGHRETDLAFTELFGGFPPSFYTAYQQLWPLERGYQERKDLYNLYHLLNHLNLFGEGYGGSVDRILRRYVG